MLPGELQNVKTVRVFERGSFFRFGVHSPAMRMADF